MSSRSPNNAGFTLLEVLISIVLLVVISLAIFQSTTQTYRLRDVLMNEGDFHNSIRLSMGILERDIAAMYTPTLMLNKVENIDPVQLQQIFTGDQARASKYWAPAVSKTGLRPMRFQGTEKSMSFVSLSNIRVYKDSPESEFAKISYELQADSSKVAGDVSASVLVKTASPNAFFEDEDRDKMKKTYLLLPGVTKSKFEYYRRDRDQWGTRWDSDSADFKNIYPDMVRVTLEVRGPSRLFFEGVYQFRPEIPLRALDPSI